MPTVVERGKFNILQLENANVFRNRFLFFLPTKGGSYWNFPKSFPMRKTLPMEIYSEAATSLILLQAIFRRMRVRDFSKRLSSNSVFGENCVYHMKTNGNQTCFFFQKYLTRKVFCRKLFLLIYIKTVNLPCNCCEIWCTKYRHSVFKLALWRARS